MDNFKIDNNNKISNFGVKKQLIEYIYNRIDFKRYRYKLLETMNDLEIFKKEKFTIAPNYIGTNTLFVATQIRDKYYNFLIDRKALNPNKDLIDIYKLKLQPVSFRLDTSIYKGTIFDGTLINTSSGKIYMITDVYYLNGKDLQDELLVDKLLNLKMFMKNCFKPDPLFETIHLDINKLFEPINLKQTVDKFATFELNKYIKGVTFYPNISGLRMIYIDKTPAQNKYNLITNDIELSPVKKHIIKDNLSCITAIFEVRKTDIVDVYNTYLFSSKKDTKRKKFGKLSIPNKDCSIYYQSLFKTDDRLLIECKYDASNDWWEPIKLRSDVSEPDQHHKVKKRIYK